MIQKWLCFQKFTSPIKGFSVEPILKEDTVRIAHTQIGAGTEFAVMLVKAMKLTTGDQKTAFKDAIAPWAEPYIAAAVGQGFIAGYPDGTFRPGSAITREEMAVIIVRALKLETTGQLKPDFFDAHQNSAWAMPSIAALQDKKIMNGIEKISSRQRRSPQGRRP